MFTISFERLYLLDKRQPFAYILLKVGWIAVVMSCWLKALKVTSPIDTTTPLMNRHD